MASNGGVYKVSQGEVTGFVKAQNQLSAQAEINWIAYNVNCFCQECRNWLLEQHSTYISELPHGIEQVHPKG